MGGHGVAPAVTAQKDPAAVRSGGLENLNDLIYFAQIDTMDGIQYQSSVPSRILHVPLRAGGRLTAL
jgi:hypothetical protein